MIIEPKSLVLGALIAVVMKYIMLISYLTVIQVIGAPPLVAVAPRGSHLNVGFT